VKDEIGVSIQSLIEQLQTVKARAQKTGEKLDEALRLVREVRSQ
jgi:hypothetical protein